MKVVTTAQKQYIEGLVTSLECEGYYFSAQPISLYLGDSTETTPFAIAGKRPDNGKTPLEELHILYAVGCVGYPGEQSWRIIADNGDLITWP